MRHIETYEKNFQQFVCKIIVVIDRSIFLILLFLHYYMEYEYKVVIHTVFLLYTYMWYEKYILKWLYNQNDLMNQSQHSEYICHWFKIIHCWSIFLAPIKKPWIYSNNHKWICPCRKFQLCLYLNPQRSLIHVPIF